jgi:S1-C subfamily serine protease
LALLRLTRNPFRGELGAFPVGPPAVDWLRAVVRFDDRRPDDGVAIAVSGYPFAIPDLYTNSGGVATSWATRQVNRQLLDVYIGDLQVNPGNSGGPVYLIDTAEIIGVCVSHSLSAVWTRDAQGSWVQAEINDEPLMINSGIANIIPTKYVINLMTKNNIAVHRENIQ